MCGTDLCELDGILITHEHSDHICGLNTIVKRCGVPIFAPRTVANHLRYCVTGVENSLREIAVGEEVDIGGVTVRAFHTPHDTDESVGYRISGEEVFALATDMGCVTEEIMDGLRGADAVLIEANHDVDMLKNGPYPFPLKRRILSPRGHLSNSDCAGLAEYLAENGTKYIILGHLSRENNRPDLAFGAVKPVLADTAARLFVAGADSRLTLEVEEGSFASG